MYTLIVRWRDSLDATGRDVYTFTTLKDAETAQRLLQGVTDGADPDPMYFSEIVGGI